jgi:hypothetical protein
MAAAARANARHLGRSEGAVAQRNAAGWYLHLYACMLNTGFKLMHGLATGNQVQRPDSQVQPIRLCALLPAADA